MKYVDEFRDPEKAQFLLKEIRALVPQIQNARTGNDPIYIMEVCGGHTHAIFRYGVETMLPDGIELIHGPGCPVCVLPMGRVDDCVALAHMPGMIFTTFGDAMRVPGSKESLLQAKANGADVRMVYSPLDSLRIAKENPDRQVVFFALGFETTMPSTALTVLRAKKEGIKNFSLFCNHITIIPTIKAILDSPDLQLDGFLGPGHVSMVIGNSSYQIYRRTLQEASGDCRFRAARYPARHLDGAQTDRRRSHRDREPIQPRGSRRRQHRGSGCDRQGLRVERVL